MINIVQKRLCTGCSACACVCPKNAIAMASDREGFSYPQIDNKLCVDCGLCEKTCPVSKEVSNSNTLKGYGAVSREQNVRKNSTSGGVFYHLAKHIIENNGVVFGAKFDQNFNVVHGCIKDINDICLFQGSKYVQSDLGDSFIRVKKFLLDGKLVLFSGTPCQIGGLKAYLGKEYPNLYLQEVICHGVPSPLVWKKYLDTLKKKYKSDVKSVSFRNKESGWNTYKLAVDFNNGKKYRKYKEFEPYLLAFVNDLILRPSCYDCKFKGDGHIGDIILADFWGVGNIIPDLNDDKGVSFVLTLNDKGEKLFKNSCKDINYREVDYERALSHNPSFSTSAGENANRKEFFESLDTTYIIKNIKSKLQKTSFILNLKIRLYRLLKK